MENKKQMDFLNAIVKEGTLILSGSDKSINPYRVYEFRGKKFKVLITEYESENKIIKNKIKYKLKEDFIPIVLINICEKLLKNSSKKNMELFINEVEKYKIKYCEVI